jgi:parallel beta-helix repeat protein
MSLSRLLQLFTARRQPRLSLRAFRPSLDKLEDRRLLATFTVDDDFPAIDNVPQRRYDKIQEAVNAANPGDTINVRPGTYEENVLVNKRLTIQGSGGRPVVDPVNDLAAGSPAYGFNLQANDIVIRNFQIGEFDSVTDPDGTVGINTSKLFSGYKIQNNIIEENVFGIYLNTATSGNVKQTEVTGNIIRNNNEGLGVLSAAGNGIYSDQGARNVRITGNSFTEHENEDIIFVAPAPLVQKNLTIQHNVLKDSSGIFFINVTDSTIAQNAITRSFANAIELAGGNHRVVIRQNALLNVGTDGFNGIFVHNNSGAGRNTLNTIQQNAIHNAGLSGIVIRESDQNVIKHNVVNKSQGDNLSDPNWGNGIGLEDADNNTVEHNTLNANARHGIFVGRRSIAPPIPTGPANSTGNIIRHNVVTNVPSGNFAYFDETSGTGTAGTANTWTKNKGQLRSPSGLG